MLSGTMSIKLSRISQTDKGFNDDICYFSFRVRKTHLKLANSIILYISTTRTMVLYDRTWVVFQIQVFHILNTYVLVFCI